MSLRLCVRARGAVLASTLWLCGGSAAAEDDGSAAPAVSSADVRVVALNERGSALYAEADYRRAVELFLQAYAIDADPNLLFNIAACYEGLGDRDAAIEKYRAFLADPSAEPEGRPRAETALQRLMSGEGAAGPEPLDAGSMPAALAPATPALSSAATPASVPENAGPAPSGLPSWAPWVAWGGGAALGVGGAALYMLGAADHREVTDAEGYDDPEAVLRWTRSRAEARVRSGDTKKALGACSMVLGGALMGGYALWWMLERPDEQQPAPRLDLALSPSGAALSWGSHF